MGTPLGTNIFRYLNIDLSFIINQIIHLFKIKQILNYDKIN